jgi:RNA polymerase sigma-70 factor (ECF subfamily)
MAMAQPNLKALLQAVAEGDRAAFGALYEATSAKLFGVAIRILKRTDLAEDAVQDSYLKIWDGANGYRPALGTPLGWMVTITRNRSIDMLRKRAEKQLGDEAGDTFLDETVPDPFASVAQGAELRAFLGCLSKLDDGSQRCLLLAYYFGYTHEEIAARVAAPVGTVKSRIRRGLARIRECLSDG